MKEQIVVTMINDELTISANGFVQKTYNVPKIGYKLIMVSFRFTGGGDNRRILPKSLYLTDTNNFDATWQNLDNSSVAASIGYYLMYSKI